jgi:xylulokinase
MEYEAALVPAGSEGVLFTPWLAGSRAPFSDDGIGAMFYNLHSDTGKAALARSTLEGVCFQFRWLYECQMRSLKIKSRNIRLCGGAAGSPLFCQILADVLGQQIEVPAFPQDSGVIGLSCLSAIAEGQLDSFGDIVNVVRAERVYVPNPENRPIYDRLFMLYKNIYKANKHILNRLNG